MLVLGLRPGESVVAKGICVVEFVEYLYDYQQFKKFAVLSFVPVSGEPKIMHVPFGKLTDTGFGFKLMANNKGTHIALGFDAPKEIRFVRTEVLEREVETKVG
jgi:hypothetical protein